MTEVEKGPSKNELKKLAKKAEKKAAKEAKSVIEVPVPAVPSSTVQTSTILPVTNDADLLSTDPKTFYLAHADKCLTSTLKCAISAAAFDIDLSHSISRGSVADTMSFFNGPALFDDETGNSRTTIAFGGNGVSKAIALLSGGGNVSPIVDEWLELERTCLRPGMNNKCEGAFVKIEEALNGGYFLVGNGLTLADICIVTTLAASNQVYSKILQEYISMHASSEIFVKGKKVADDLVSPPPYNIDKNASLLESVHKIFKQALSSAFPDSNNFDFKVERSKQLKFGDYQCIAAMPLFMKLKASGKLPSGVKSTQDIAHAIVAAIPLNNPVLNNCVVNGPGFILCRIKASFLEHRIDKIVQTGKVTISDKIPKQGETVVVDFSSPNIAKEMHVGHLRSTIIGEAVCRIMEFVRADVKRVNHVGDWGTQFGMLITFLKEKYPELGEGADIKNVDIGDLTQFYKTAKARFDDDPQFKKTSQLNVVKLQSGDEECRKIWKILCDISRTEFKKVYARLEVSLYECGESFYNDKIPSVISEFEKAGLVKIEEGGAKCVFLPKYKIPLMLQKSDGGFGYDSTDMAALKYRLQDLGANRLTYITDFSQGDHFQMCYAAAELIGWVDPKKHKLEHIGFGTVMGQDGKRFKTRSGETIRLVDLLDEAVNRMEISLKKRLEENSANISLDEVSKTAATLGYSAVKYFDLRRNPTTNYKFDYDSMLDTKGNTAIYLLYAHARLESICTKGKTNFNIDLDELSSNIVLSHPSERNLALQLQVFSDMLEQVLGDLYPYHICEYLYAVSIAASDFITQCKVLGSPEMESRLLLCRATTIVMRQCFDLLAIHDIGNLTIEDSIMNF